MSKLENVDTIIGIITGVIALSATVGAIAGFLAKLSLEVIILLVIAILFLLLILVSLLTFWFYGKLAFPKKPKLIKSHHEADTFIFHHGSWRKIPDWQTRDYLASVLGFRPGEEDITLKPKEEIDKLRKGPPLESIFTYARPIIREQIENIKQEQSLPQVKTSILGVDYDKPEAPIAKTRVNTDLSLRDVFKLTKKEFVEDSTPQKLVIQYTNRGNNIIQIKEVRFSATAKLSESDILSSYRVGKKGRFIIPFDLDKAEVLPGEKFTIEIHLAKKWNRDDINGLIGNLGYVDIDLMYKDEPENEFQGI